MILPCRRAAAAAIFGTVPDFVLRCQRLWPSRRRSLEGKILVQTKYLPDLGCQTNGTCDRAHHRRRLGRPSVTQTPSPQELHCPTRIQKLGVICDQHLILASALREVLGGCAAKSRRTSNLHGCCAAKSILAAVPPVEYRAHSRVPLGGLQASDEVLQQWIVRLTKCSGTHGSAA